jgi:hypothetical protein
LIGIQRAHAELYVRHLGESGLMDSSVITMMHGVRGFFRYAHIDGTIASDPAVYARLPKVHRDESRTQGLDRLELIRSTTTARAATSTATVSTPHRLRCRGLSPFEVGGAHFPSGTAAKVPAHLVPGWYRWRMAMNLRLTDEESEALRAKAEQEGRSMQEVAKTAIAQYVSDRPRRLLSAIERVRTEDQELLERLSQ